MKIIDLNNDYGIITVSGPDAERFLQGQLSCDMREITSNAIHLGAFCNLKGRIRALFRIIKNQENEKECFLLQLPKTLLPRILTELKKYARFSKVILQDDSDSFYRIGVIKSPSSEQGNKLSSSLVKETVQETIQNTIPDLHMLSLAIPEKLNHYEIIVSRGTGNIIEKLNTLYSDTSIETADFDAWKLADIRACIPEVWLETSEKFLPHHLNLPALNGVSFKKGCYCGQEIIARMQYRGNIKRQMTHAIFEKLEQVNEKDSVVSFALNENNKIEALVEVAACSIDSIE